MTRINTRTIEVPGAVLTYDFREPEAPGDHRPLFIFGSPMGASGFEQLVGHFTDRTVLTYDPRGMERSTRDPTHGLTAEVHAEDYHRVVEAAGLGPVDAFGSSGGGMCGLHWVVAHPNDARTFVAPSPLWWRSSGTARWRSGSTPTSWTPISARGSARRWPSSFSS